MKKLLIELMNKETGKMFSVSNVVVDSDSEMSGKGVVTEILNQGEVPVKYSLKARQDILLARKKQSGMLEAN